MARQVEAAKRFARWLPDARQARSAWPAITASWLARMELAERFESEVDVEDRAEGGGGQHLVQGRAGAAAMGDAGGGARVGPPRAGAGTQRRDAAQHRLRAGRARRHRAGRGADRRGAPHAAGVERGRADRLRADRCARQDAAARSRRARRRCRRRRTTTTPACCSRSASSTWPSTTDVAEPRILEAHRPHGAVSLDVVGRGSAVSGPGAGEDGKDRREPESLRAVPRVCGRTPTPGCRSWPPRRRNTPRWRTDVRRHRRRRGRDGQRRRPPRGGARGARARPRAVRHPARSRNSSHGLSRIIRLAYWEHPDYVPLVKRAYDLWLELEAAAGERLLVVTGSIDAGAATGPNVAGARAACRRFSLGPKSSTRAR